MKTDLHNNIAARRVISPIAVGTTGTGKTGVIIDRMGYGAVEFLLSFGAITATNAVFTATMKEGDATSAMTSVADADLLGLEANCVPATGTRTSGSNMNVTKRIGYKGIKRYVQMSLKSTVTAAAVIGVDAILGKPELAPVAT